MPNKYYARAATRKLKGLPWNSKIREQNKIRIYKTIIESTVSNKGDKSNTSITQSLKLIISHNELPKQIRDWTLIYEKKKRRTEMLLERIGEKMNLLSCMTMSVKLATGLSRYTETTIIKLLFLQLIKLPN